MYRKHLRMARGEGETQDTGLRSHFVERVVKLPMVHVAWDYATATYSHLKEYSKLANFTLTNAEKSVSFVAEQAKPVVRKFEKQIQVVDTLACRGLGTLEEKVPLITKAPEQILGETRKLYSDTVHSRIEGIRNYSNGKVKSVADYGVQKAVDIFGTNLVQSVITSVDGALLITEHFLDIVLPPIQGESQNDVNSEDEKERKSVLSRVGHLSSKLRLRAYKHINQKIENVQEMALDILLFPVILAHNAKENLEAAQKYSKGLWEALSKEESEGTQNGVLLKMTRVAVRPFVETYVLLRSFLPGRHSETTETADSSQHHDQSPAVISTVKNGVLWTIGMLRLVPAMTVVYGFALLSWLERKNSPREEDVDGVTDKENEQNKKENDGQSSAVVNAVKDGVLWTIGMIRLVPNMAVVYVLVFLSWLEQKNSPQDEGVDVQTENEQNKEENHVVEIDGEVQQTQM